MKSPHPITLLRAKHGMTQQAFADAIGIHKNSLSKIERGLAQPRPVTLAAMESVTGVSVIELHSQCLTAKTPA